MAWNPNNPYPPGPYTRLPLQPPTYYPPGTAAPQPPVGGYPYNPSAPSYPNPLPYPPYSPPYNPPAIQGQWVHASHGIIPPGAVSGGFDAGNEIYVARAYKHGRLLIGKVVRGHSCCYVPWDGKEHHCKDYEVLCHSYGGQWVSSSCFPSNAVVGGGTDRGECLYVGRVIHHSASVIGGIYRSHGVCKYPYGGKEHHAHHYEVLVLN